MLKNYLVIVACVSLIAPRLVISKTTDRKQESLLELANSRLETLKYAIEVINARTELLESRFEQLLRPPSDLYGNVSAACDYKNRALLQTLVDDTQLIRRKQYEIGNMLGTLQADFDKNVNINQIETTTPATKIDDGEGENETSTNDDNEIKDILNEVLNKQIGLEAVFQLILESSEKNSTADFIKAQFDDLKKFIREMKSSGGGRVLPLHDENLNCLQNCHDTHGIYDSCESAMTSNALNEGVYLLKIPNSDLEPFYAYCTTFGHQNWLVIQRREDGSQNFYRNWHDYKSGFGDVFNEYWLGLERLHAITNSGSHQLLIVMDDFNQCRLYAKYNHFSIGNDDEGYRLRVGYYEGNATDALTEHHNENKFSTFDRDNDNARENCALFYKGAWWYNKCYMSNLNGPYFSYADSWTSNGITWGANPQSLRRVFMAVSLNDKFQ